MEQTLFTVGRKTFTILFPDLLRPLSKKERELLSSSIVGRGVVSPVVVDEEGGVIDGGNRVAIAAGLRLNKIPFVVQEGLTLEQKVQLAVSLNHARRHLSPKEWRQLHKERQARISRVVEMRRQGMSTRQIAAEEGVSHTQVAEDLKSATKEADKGAIVKGFTIPPIATPNVADDAPALFPPPEAESPGLAALRKAWKKATAADRKAFLKEVTR